MTNFNITSWIWTFAIGLPILALVAWLRWRQSQTSVLWRWVLCTIIACIITPFIFKDESADIFPAVGALLAVLVAAFRGQLHAHDYFGAFWVWVLPIPLASLVLLGIWSAIISMFKKRKEYAA